MNQKNTLYNAEAEEIVELYILHIEKMYWLAYSCVEQKNCSILNEFISLYGLPLFSYSKAAIQ